MRYGVPIKQLLIGHEKITSKQKLKLMKNGKLTINLCGIKSDCK